MTKTYTTISDLAQLELRDLLMSDDAFAELDDAAQALVTDRLTTTLKQRDIIVWADGYDEASDTTYLNDQGFRLNLAEDLEGSDLWDAVFEALEFVDVNSEDI